MAKNRREFVLANKKDEAENIVSLFFTPADGLSFDFFAGQYVSVALPSFSGPSKCYTISSAPKEKLICITVKRRGDFSSALIDSKVGDKLIFNGPYGNFYPEENFDDLVFVAGGMGVTPFFSVIKDRSNYEIKPKITLLYSNKTILGTAFFEELNELKENKIIDNLVYFLTQEKSKIPLTCEYGRMNGKLLKKYLDLTANKNYYLCGSIQFVNAIWKDLKESGVPEENIFTESFY